MHLGVIKSDKSTTVVKQQFGNNEGSFHLGPFQTSCPCPGTKIGDVQTRQCPEPKMFISNFEKVLTKEKSATHLSWCLNGKRESKYSEH